MRFQTLKAIIQYCVLLNLSHVFSPHSFTYLPWSLLKKTLWRRLSVLEFGARFPNLFIKIAMKTMIIGGRLWNPLLVSWLFLKHWGSILGARYLVVDTQRSLSATAPSIFVISIFHAIFQIFSNQNAKIQIQGLWVYKKTQRNGSNVDSR